MISEYYQRFIQVLQDDLDQMLTEVDPTKRNHKQMKSLLEMLEESISKVQSIDNESGEWDHLSEDAKRRILEIIQTDREGVTHEVQG